MLRYVRPEVVAAAFSPATLPRFLFHLVVILLVLLAALAARADTGSFDGPITAAASLPALSSDRESQTELLVSPAVPRSETPVRWPAATGRLKYDSSEAQQPATEPRVEGQPARGDAKPREPFKYAVAAGDTVSGIASSFGISRETVLWANSLGNPDSLQVGEELVILPVSGVLHAVASGDSVNDLALAYGVAAEKIVEFNGISDPDMLVVGQKLVVPEGKIQVGRASPSSRGARPSSGGASGSFRWPAGGNITQYFGQSGHSGIDIAGQHGSPIYAADAGVVTTALKLNYDYGWYLVIDHGNGYRTLYAHMSAFHVDYGERVGKGERIGSVGSTGLSTGPHLHFEVFQNGVRVNPLKFLP